MTIIPTAVWILVLSCAAACAETSTAQFKGTVKESSGLPLAGAEVKVTETATAAVRTMVTGADGEFFFVGLRFGTYTLEISKPGFEMFVQSGVLLSEDATVTLDAALKQQTTPSSGTTVPSLGDLGFSPVEAQGSAQDQARLDRRSHMLKTHQRLGLITLAPMLATFVSSAGAAGRHGTVSGRELHAALGATSAGLYWTTASFAIFAPKPPGITTRGTIRVHKALAWIHGPGMILTPVLGAMAFNQLNRGERVHGIASAHSAVAWVTGAAYASAILSVSIKF
jgi:hypothetical protein